MGNHLCGILKKRKEDADGTEGRATDSDEHAIRTLSKPEVLYATIDHGDRKAQGKTEDKGEDSCDYAIINMSSGSAHTATIEVDCTDDYVLMS